LLRLRAERRREEKRKRGIPFSELYDSIAILTFGRPSERIARSFRLFESMERAGMNLHPTLYVARILLAISIVLFAAIIATIFVVLSPLPLKFKIAIVLPLYMVPPLLFAIGLTYPSTKASKRAEAVNAEFPFFAAYMTAMAYGGMTPERLIERLTEIKVFKALREEARRIMRDVKLLAKDILSALEHNALRHPSRLYRDFMLGYLTTIRTGGSIHHYLEVRTQEVIQARMEDLRNRAERVGLIVEAYAAVAVLGTLSFYIFFVVSGLISGEGGALAGIRGLIVYNFIVLPVITIAIVLMLSETIPSYGSIREPYIYFVLSIPLAFIAGLAIATVTGVLGKSLSSYTVSDVAKLSAAFGAALIVASVPPAVSYIKISRRETAINRALPAFFRDLSEIRRTGLSPERSIIMLAERNYGVFSEVVKRIAAALSMGLPVEKAARMAIKGVRSWLLRVSMRFLIDAIEVGGGTPTTIDSLARFMSTLIELMESIKRRLRPYILMPYIGAIIVAVSSIMTASMLVNAMSAMGMKTGTLGFGALRANISPQQVVELLAIASIASIFNAWLNGLVAGKIASIHTTGGFLHAALLTFVVVISVITALTFSSSLLGLPAR